MIGAAGAASAASSERLRDQVKDQPPAVIYPHFPERSNVDEYCRVWSQKAMYGAGAFLRAKDQERAKNLVVTYQTSAEDKAHPETFNSVDTDDGPHATVIVLTDGVTDEGQKWVLDDQAKEETASAMHEGWAWTKENLIYAEFYRSRPIHEWAQMLWTVCKKQLSAKDR
jgi:hypothetical protein